MKSVSASDIREAAGCVCLALLTPIHSCLKGILRIFSAHFDALAHDNDATSKNIHKIEEVSNGSDGATPNPVLLYGTQSVQKFNSKTTDEVRILLALFRVKDKNIDLVMTMNVPMTSADGGAVSESDWTAAKGVFDIAAKSLRIVDYGLFE